MTKKLGKGDTKPIQERIQMSVKKMKIPNLTNNIFKGGSLTMNLDTELMPFTKINLKMEPKAEC